MTNEVKKVSIEQAQVLVKEARLILDRLDAIQQILRQSGFEAYFDDQSHFHCKAIL